VKNSLIGMKLLSLDFLIFFVSVCTYGAFIGVCIALIFNLRVVQWWELPCLAFGIALNFVTMYIHRSSWPR
jgi:hypothetical protein